MAIDPMREALSQEFSAGLKAVYDLLDDAVTLAQRHGIQLVASVMEFEGDELALAYGGTLYNVDSRGTGIDLCRFSEGYIRERVAADGGKGGKP